MLADANIFLEVLLEQNKSEDCKVILREIRDGKKKAVVSTFTIDSIILVMERNKSKASDISTFINSLLNYDGLEIYQQSFQDRSDAIELMEIYNLDYEDAMTLQTAFSNDIGQILSFDKHFDRIKEIDRIEP